MAIPGFCSVMRAGIEDLSARIGKPSWEAAKNVFGKPWQLYGNISPQMKYVMNVIRRLSVSAENQTQIFARLHVLVKLNRLAGMGRDPAAAQAAAELLDKIPSHVLAGLGMKGSSAAKLDFAVVKARTLEYLKSFDPAAPNYVGPTSRFYDKRAMDPSRYDWAALEGYWNRLTANQKETVSLTAQALRKLRADSLRSKRATSSYETYQQAVQGAMRGKSPSVGELEGIRKWHDAYMEEAGLTVSSYIPHIVLDAHIANEAGDAVVRMVSKDKIKPFLDQVEKIMFEIPEHPELASAIGRNKRGEFMAKAMADWFKSPEGGSLDPAMIDGLCDEDFGKQLIEMALHVNSGKGMGDVLSLMPRRVFVAYFRNRMMVEAAEGLKGVFDDLPSYASMLIRQTYLEPAHSYGMLNRGLILNEGRRASFTNYLNEIMGIPPNSGIHAVLNKIPGARNAIGAIESNIVKVAYWKALWASPSAAFVNATQLLQLGFGPQGLYHLANAMRMLCAEDGFFMQRIAEMGVSSGGFSSNYGASAMRGVKTSMNPFTNVKSDLAPFMEMMHRAESRGEMFRIVRSMGIRGTAALLDFMGHVETALRVLTSTAAMHESAVLQLLERYPGAKVVKRGFDFKVVLPDGTTLSPIEELRKSFAAFHGEKKVAVFEPRPKAPSGEEMLAEAAQKGTNISWRRVTDDALSKNMDVNFDLGGTNYSVAEKTIRGIPIVGPAAGVFMNFTTQLVARTGSQLMTMMKWTAQQAAKSTLGSMPFGAEVTSQEAMRAFRSFSRFCLGTLLIGGPYAFRPMIEAALKAGNKMDSNIPADIEDPRVKAILDHVEAYTLTGLTGVDLSERIGLSPGDLASFMSGNRFTDNPLARIVQSAFGLGAETEEDKAKLRYRFYGRWAGFMDKERGPSGYGHEIIGRDFPLVPIFVYNLLKMGVDMYDQAHFGGTVDALGRQADPVLPTGLLVKRGIMGRTIYDREKMRAIADENPALSARLTSIRRNYADATFEGDQERVLALNAEYQKLAPVAGLDPTQQEHPDLKLTKADWQRYFFAHATPAEFRQLRFGAKGVARIALDRSLDYLRRKGMLTNAGLPDYDKIMESNDALVLQNYYRVVAVLGRPSGREAFYEIDNDTGEPMPSGQE